MHLQWLQSLWASCHVSTQRDLQLLLHAWSSGTASESTPLLAIFCLCTEAAYKCRRQRQQRQRHAEFRAERLQPSQSQARSVVPSGKPAEAEAKGSHCLGW